jgi:Rha family phage regulatory protein
MGDIVYYSSQDLVVQKVFTNSRLVAERFKKQHSKVIRAIENQIEMNIQNKMEYFNGANFGLVDYVDEKGERRKMYELTEDGFISVAISFTGREAHAIRVRLIEEFRNMEEELKKRKITRQIGVDARNSLTNSIKMSYTGDKLGFKIKAYTDLIYTKVIGCSTKAYKVANEIPKGENLRDYLTADQIREIDRLEQVVSFMVDNGDEYQAVKEAILRRGGRQHVISSGGSVAPKDTHLK